MKTAAPRSRRDRARAQGQHAPLVKQRGEDRSEQEQPHALGRGVGGAIDDDLRATASEVARDAVDLQPQLARRDLEPDPAANGARQLRRDPTGHDLDVGLARRFRQLRQGQARGDRQAEGAVEKGSRHLAGGTVVILAPPHSSRRTRGYIPPGREGEWPRDLQSVAPDPVPHGDEAMRTRLLAWPSGTMRSGTPWLGCCGQGE